MMRCLAPEQTGTGPHSRWGATEKTFGFALFLSDAKVYVAGHKVDRGLIHSKKRISHHQEAKKSKMKVLACSVSGEDPLPTPHVAGFSLLIPCNTRSRDLSEVSWKGTLTPFKKPLLLIP